MEAALARAMAAIALILVASAFGVAGLGFLLAAEYLVLLQVVRPWAAALLTGLTALSLAMILLLVVRNRRPARAVSAAGAGGDEADILRDLGRTLGDQSGRWLRSHKREALIAALVAGFAFGVSPGLRRAVQRLASGARR
jgi:hypothetical protein